VQDQVRRAATGTVCSTAGKSFPDRRSPVCTRRVPKGDSQAQGDLQAQHGCAV